MRFLIWIVDVLGISFANMGNDGSTYGLARPDLLEKANWLFACTVGGFIDIPQLVVA